MYITQTIVYAQAHKRTIAIYEEDVKEINEYLKEQENSSDIEITISDIMNCAKRSDFVSPLDKKLKAPLRHYVKIWLDDKFDYDPIDDDVVSCNRIDEFAMEVEED